MRILNNNLVLKVYKTEEFCNAKQFFTTYTTRARDGKEIRDGKEKCA